MGLKGDRSGSGLTVPDLEPRRCSLSPIDGAQGVPAGLKVGVFRWTHDGSAEADGSARMSSSASRTA